MMTRTQINRNHSPKPWSNCTLNQDLRAASNSDFQVQHSAILPPFYCCAVGLAVFIFSSFAVFPISPSPLFLDAIAAPIKVNQPDSYTGAINFNQQQRRSQHQSTTINTIPFSAVECPGQEVRRIDRNRVQSSKSSQVNDSVQLLTCFNCGIGLWSTRRVVGEKGGPLNPRQLFLSY